MHLYFQMNKVFQTIIISFIFSCSVIAQTLTGIVVSIADGDTFTLLDSTNKPIKIRLHGIDCPERKQAHSKQATDFISERIFRKNVTVIVKDIDRYRRIVGEVFYNGKTNLNIELLANGFAWHYKRYDKSEAYSKAEQSAKEKHLGLWQDKNSVAPWDYRKKKKVADA